MGAGSLLVASLSTLGVATTLAGCGEGETNTSSQGGASVSSTQQTTVAAYGVGPTTSGGGDMNGSSMVAAYGVGPSVGVGGNSGNGGNGGNG